MDLKRLSYFVSACQEHSFAAAAAELDITQSTLSAALKTLSEEFGAPLFDQVHRRLHPTQAGVWLYRSALLLLHAEEFARNWITDGPDDLKSAHIVVDIRASFAFGRLAKALSRAIQIFNRTHPDIFVQPCFSAMRTVPGQARSIAGSLGAGRRSLMVIEARPSDVDRYVESPDSLTTLANDPWVVMQAAHLPHDARHWSPAPASYMVPDIDAVLLDQAIEATGGPASGIVQSCDEPAAELLRLIWDQPDQPFLVPRSLAPNRAGLENIDIRPFEPAISCQLIARHEADDANAKTLAKIMQEVLASPDEHVAFRPTLSYRQMRFSRALFDRGSITGAARSLSMAQPALTEALQKLENGVGLKFFHRSRGGLVPTAAGQRLNAAAHLIGEGVRRITVQSASVAGAEGGRLKIGVVPSEGETSITALCIARAIGAWRKRFPSIRLEVLQGSASALQTMVAAGTIGLAVTERTAPGMARFKLADTDMLSVVANPRFNLLRPGPIRLADVVNLPLVLPTPVGGLRQILDLAVMDAHLKLMPIVEVNSIPVILAMLREQRVCTVLPTSSVQSQINSGHLRCHPIIEPTLARQFYAFHSGDRELSDPERQFLKCLQFEFMRVDNPAGDPQDAVVKFPKSISSR